METEELSNVEGELNADSSICKVNGTNKCVPCKIMKKSVIANKYCDECEENLCEDCVTGHAKRKATASHKPLPIGEKNTIPCSPCKDVGSMAESITYCKECDEYLCTDCTHSHRIRKATKAHQPVAIDDMDVIQTKEIMVELCDPCKDKGDKTNACTYCTDCDENLCNSCAKSHTNRKATRTHQLTLASDQKEKGNKVVDQNRKLCQPCKLINIEKDADSFCDECEELLCNDCTTQHRERKITKLHTLKSPDCVQYVIKNCEICEAKDQRAAMFCNTCSEALCEACGMRHKKQNATKSHSIDSIHGKILERIIRCDICRDDIIKAESYCTNCEEYYCNNCTLVHKRQKRTAEHTLISPVSAREKEDKQTKEDAICEGCDKGKYGLKYCVECRCRLCEECCDIHKRSKFTKSHVLQEPADVKPMRIPDCNSCESPGSAESYCGQCGEFFCKTCNMQHQKFKKTREHKVVSVQDGLQNKGAEQNLSEIKQLRQDEGKPDNTLQQNERRKKERPGIPRSSRSSDVMSDTITLSWDPPSIFGDDDFYQISYKDIEPEKKWKFFQGEFRDTTAVLRGLKSSTTFIFRVRIVHEDGEGPYSEESSPVCTADSPASRIVQSSTLKEEGTPSPSIYALPVTEIRQARNERAKTKKIEFGVPPIQNRKSKTIMLVGATGTGKSTLVDGIANYVLGVNWDDPFRFTVIDLEQEEKNKANEGVNQTRWITCYTINPEKGSRLKYPLNIIDTPGFEDTRGLNIDQDIFQQIRQLFSEREPKSVTFIDAVCFVMKAPDACITVVQSYLFQSIMSLFGRDIENNICSLVTFADGIDPPVLAALKGSGLPFGKSFTFNNSGLFARNSNNSSASLLPIFWNLGLKSFRAFFYHLEQIETKSLQLTKDVLDNRSRLEAAEKILQLQLDAGLSKVNSMKQTIAIIEKNKSLINDNKNFEYEVEETRQKKKELPRGQNVIICLNCHFTCHDNCDCDNDDTKAKCSAIGSNGNCKICPDQCHWRKHVSQHYVFEYSKVKVKKIYADMQKKYQEALGQLLSQEKVVEKLGEELNDLLDDIEDMMDTIKLCNEVLETIALRRNPLTMTDHIDLMIENEKLEKEEGFLQRINILNDFRKKAQISKYVEFFSQQARSTLGAAEKKRKSDTKSLNARFGSWLSNKFT